MKKILFLFLFVVIIIGGAFIFNNYRKEDPNQKYEKIDEIKNHYNSVVRTNKEADLFAYENDEYVKIGTINQNSIINLSEMIVDENTKYFHLKDLDLFIEYINVDKADEVKINDSHYKNYVVFNENIITQKRAKFYNQTDYLYQIEEEISLPIIIKDTDKYYVEYGNELLYVKIEDVKELIQNNNTEELTRDNIRTFAYHFVYKEGEECTNSYICHPESQFDEQMKYLNDNDYFTLTMNDLELFLDGKIRIPEKSTVITLDDGYLARNAIDILEKHKLRATYFIITAWNDITNLKSDYVELHSHTDNMHNNYKCSGGNQGGQLLCEDKKLITDDLNKSSEKLNGSKILCYPFYDYNDHIINILKELEWKMAFIGAETTNGVANQNIDKFKIPRLTISSETTLQEFINYLK